MKIVSTTNNKHKLEEIKDILGKNSEVVSLTEIGCYENIPEAGAILEENTRQESSHAAEHYGQDCSADDTGLEVEVLGGEPGIYSTHYAKGTDHDSKANMRKLLASLEGKADREAYLRTIISPIIDGVEHQFEGKIEDGIATEGHGTKGFGYDPILIPGGYGKSFTELGEEIENQTSRRARAVKKLAEYLGKLKG